MNFEFDMHTHILSGIDDGARNVEESLILISRLRRAGINHIALTPHYYTHKESLEDFLSRRNESYSLLKGEVSDDVKLYLGAEVFVTKYLFLNDWDLSPVCYEGTNYMLCEFPYYSTFHDEAGDYIDKLMYGHKIIPVLTHVERYSYLMKHPEVIEELMSRGIIIQSNACSFERFSLKNKLIKFVRNGLVGIIGSDAHSLERNSPDAFNTLNELIHKKELDEFINTSNMNSRKILGLK